MRRSIPILLLLACQPPAPQPSSPEPSQPTPAPTVAEPTPEPPAVEPAASEESRRSEMDEQRASCGVVELAVSPDQAFAEARLAEPGEHSARYVFEGEAFTNNLEITIEDSGAIALRHPKRKALSGGGLDCSQFSEGEGANAQILDHGALADGRRVLEVWISCAMGEDIRSVDSEIWLVVDDGKNLSRLWSGSASFNGSWVCANFDSLSIDRVGEEFVITKAFVWEIYEPAELPGYDCENAKEAVEPRGCERVAAPR